MKKLLFLAGLFIATAASAQFKKGDLSIGAETGHNGYQLFAGGNSNPAAVFGFNSYKGDGQRYYSLNLNPSFGYAVNNWLVAGGSLGIGYLRFGNHRVSNISLKPQARGYFDIGIPRTRLLARAEAGLGRLVSKEVPADDDDTSYNTLSLAGGAGLAYFIAPSASLDATIGYDAWFFSRVGRHFRRSSMFDRFGVNAGFSIFF